MPHVIVKMYAGKTDAQKQALTEAVTQAVMTALGSSESSISVALEEHAPERWADDVYRPDIVERASTLTKAPGYNPFAPK